jgi:hypothetical protein
MLIHLQIYIVVEKPVRQAKNIIMEREQKKSLKHLKLMLYNKKRKVNLQDVVGLVLPIKWHFYPKKSDLLMFHRHIFIHILIILSF